MCHCNRREEPRRDSGGERDKWAQMSIEEHMEFYMGEGMEKKDAMKQVAKDRGVSKREIYQALVNLYKIL